MLASCLWTTLNSSVEHHTIYIPLCILLLDCGVAYTPTEIRGTIFEVTQYVLYEIAQDIKSHTSSIEIMVDSWGILLSVHLVYLQKLFL